ncbi:uncharacterized protein MELLADRAFT_67449 [Melampsora larici-populina 98AG31]|uniref:Uncharacterized protein n=1 Tax=Melampsora larici-populina (strain 98AG31 / pathotype 3-4-7) TaxID=747676 RepID=F4S369_MELLP|nr:uncharacterized protein MELLADRAFT_67449 [Melampsora larici-populina 98AG31]EGG00961.1 hypothetical protein MELLADRAFT_67449 [Melampsora larici-populina 98AG31]
MYLHVIPPESMSDVPECVLTHDVQYDSSFYQKKSKPFAKVSMPVGYTQTQSLCQQFGIEPHTLLCMDSTLWRQQIIDTVTFDIPSERVSIKFVNGTVSDCTFMECENSTYKTPPVKEFKPGAWAPSELFPTSSAEGSLESRIKSKLLTQLNHLREICFARQDPLDSHLAMLSEMTHSQLSRLRKSTRPSPLAPTDFQRLKDLKRSLQAPSGPSKPRKPTTQKRRAPSLGLLKSRKKLKLAGAGDNREEKNPESQYELNFDIPSPEVYQLISRLSSFRSTLLDLFQTVILGLLRNALPCTYPLWVVKSELDYVREHFTSRAIRFAELLHGSTSLKKTQRDHGFGGSEDGSLTQLRDWCRMVKSSHLLVDEDAGHSEFTSAETSLDEPAPNVIKPHMLETFIQDHPEYQPRSLSHQITDLHPTWISLKGKEDFHGLQETVQLHSSTSSEVSSIADNQACNLRSGIDTAREAQIQHGPTYRFSRAPTPTLSPTPNRPGPISFPDQASCNSTSIFQFPTLALEPAFLSSIAPQLAQESAIELSTQLAEDCITMDKLDTTFLTITLLEEERLAKEQFAGLDRFSDVITASRLAGGWGEGHAVDIATDATITAALAAVKARIKRFADALHSQPHNTQLSSPPVLPSKQSEVRRRMAAKRRTWLAVTRRLDRSWITADPTADHGIEPVWPEPIFLKKTTKGRRKSEKRIQLDNPGDSIINSASRTRSHVSSGTDRVDNRDDYHAGTSAHLSGAMVERREEFGYQQLGEVTHAHPEYEDATLNPGMTLDHHHPELVEMSEDTAIESEPEESTKIFNKLPADETAAMEDVELDQLMNTSSGIEEIIKGELRYLDHHDDEDGEDLSDVDSEWPECSGPTQNQLAMIAGL